MGSWHLRLLLQGLLSLFQEMWLNAQPVLVLKLARIYGLDRIYACIPAASMAGLAAVTGKAETQSCLPVLNDKFSKSIITDTRQWN